MTVPSQSSDDLLRLEWLETNGLGGGAMASVAGASTRRYHGLLVVALDPPVARRVVIAKLTETLWLPDGQGVSLDTQTWAGNIVSPDGLQHLRGFERAEFPVWEFAALGIHLRRTIACPTGENTTLVLYEVLAAAGPFTLDLTPLLADRDIHAVTQANEVLNPQVTEVATDTWGGNCYRLTDWFVQAPGAAFIADPQWHYGLDYPQERARGLEDAEDLFAPGRFSVALAAGQRVGIILSTSNPGGRNAFDIFDQERQRRQRLLAATRAARAANESTAKNQGESPPTSPAAQLEQALVLAADQFVVRRGANHTTLIAGYPWFTDWGRDALISLPGLLLHTGRAAEARQVLTTFLDARHDGLVPNAFPDYPAQPISYNAADAALWAFVACHHYAQLGPEPEAFLRQQLPALADILYHYQRGTHYRIAADPHDNLLTAGEPDVQLTWMDARLGAWVVTARDGKAVELNALWYNAQRIFADLVQRLTGDAGTAAHWAALAEHTRTAFVEQFWNEDRECLFDYLEERFKSPSIRPNQLFAVSLPYPLLSGAKAKAVVRVVEEQLLTPRGLRTLAPTHPDYKSVYQGDQYHRDAAYHQGTVWAWLLGPFCDALIRTRGEAGRKRARQLLVGLLPHLQQEGVVGSISEIFDAAAPHHPRGCPAQAWSVGEVLRVWRQYGL